MQADLHVDFLGPDATGLPGRLGLTSMPGGWWPGRPGAAPGGSPLEDDLRLLAQDHGTSLLVTLLGRRELAAMGEVKRLTRRLGVEWVHHPIADMSTPDAPADLAGLVTRLSGHLEGGRTAVLHCLAGLGRTGTVAACLLVARGRSAEEALAVVRSVRPGAVQTSSQEAFVADYERFVRAGGKARTRWRLFR